MQPADLEEARDRDLIKRIESGDQDAFRGLFDRYSGTALALARRIVRQAHIAEETVQEAFLSVWRNPGAYDPGRGSVRAWLMSTVHNRSVDAVRREQAQRRRAEESIAEAGEILHDPADDVVDQIGLPQERAAVRSALGDLPPKQREVLELMNFGGLSQSQVAAKLSLPLGTVKSRTLLAMRRLRGALVWMER